MGLPVSKCSGLGWESCQQTAKAGCYQG